MLDGIESVETPDPGATSLHELERHELERDELERDELERQASKLFMAGHSPCDCDGVGSEDPGDTVAAGRGLFRVSGASRFPGSWLYPAIGKPIAQRRSTAAC